MEGRHLLSAEKTIRRLNPRRPKLELDQLKQQLQGIFTDGLVTIVGSGLSAASGLPTMAQLARHLSETIPQGADSAAKEDWAVVEASLAAGVDLENALSPIRPDSHLLPLIVTETASVIQRYEAEVIGKVVRGEQELPFASLVRHITFADKVAHVISPNYDRLLEFSAELAGIAVDTGFTGVSFGRFAPSESLMALSTMVQVKSPKLGFRRRIREHIAMHKPHGSLDWFLVDGAPVRCAFPVEAPRLMITPGGSKYRLGYESPFDYQRSAANDAIDAAARFLIIGYGFNDDQLETHLRARLKSGRPCVLLTKSLTKSAVSLIGECSSITALVEHITDEGIQGTRVIAAGEECVFDHSRLWNLSTFVKEVLSE